LILLVEDDDLVRELTRMLLESADYDVIEASRAEAALRIAADPALDLRLLVTDIQLPGLRGVELARQIRVQRPGLRVLFVSGDAIDAQALVEPGSAALGKPFSREALLKAVAGVLASGR
jgi:CheY-like chemotaxis protein